MIYMLKSQGIPIRIICNTLKNNETLHIKITSKYVDCLNMFCNMCLSIPTPANFIRKKLDI